MNWKEFLKLDKRKIVTFLIVSIIYFASVFLSGLVAVSEDRTVLAPIFGTIFLSIVFIEMAPLAALPGRVDIMDGTVATEIITTGILVLWWYLISCVILFLYDKRKSKR